MGNGDDAIRKKKNKVNRKRLRNSDSAVPARISVVIASKRRRKAGKRRISEVLDGLKSLVDSGFSDMVKSIKESISGQSRMVTFGNCYEETSKILLRSLLKGPVSRLSLDSSVGSQSALISQHVHVYTSEDEKLPKTLQILTEAFPDQKLPKDQKVLLVAENTRNAQTLASKLVAEGYAMPDDSLIDTLPTAIQPMGRRLKQSQ